MSDETPDDQTTGDSLVEAANNLENLSGEELQALLQESRIVIRPGGQVVIENLTADLLDVAYELDPDNPGIQCQIPEADAPEDAAETSQNTPKGAPGETSEDPAQPPDVEDDHGSGHS